MRENRDLGKKWPHWHTLIFSNDTKIDMRFVCPKDVKKILVQRARSVYWKTWAAKHEFEELKEGALLEPGLALLRKKVRESWTEKHRNVARKIFLEEGWTQKKSYQCQACQLEEGFEGHVATDGSLLGTAGQWGACGWSVVQLDYDEEMVSLHGMFGWMEAQYEVQRTIKRAELTAFLCFLKKVIGPIKVHVDNNGIVDGLRKGEKECTKPRAGDADLWIKKFGRNHMSGRKRHFGGSGTCEGAKC